MMKKQWIAILLACVLAFSLSACGKKQNNSTTDPSGQNQSAQNPSTPKEPSAEDTPGTSDQEPVFPDSLAKADAEVRLDELISVLGRTETDLNNAMKDVSTVGDSVSGARTYRHKLLGKQSEVSYAMGADGKIDKITVTVAGDAAEDWRTELEDTLRAQVLEGETDAWHYSDADLHLTSEDGNTVIVIEKKAG